jgi:lysophospholipid acyltransferase (LPLAT)-like uncharacterized protein
MLKRFLRSAWVQYTLGLVLAGYMSLIKHTTRWTVVGRELIEPVWEGRQGVIGCVWHGRTLMTIAGWPKGVQPAAMLVSWSPDGEFTNRAALTHGIGVIRGGARNPKKKGKDAQKGAIAAFRQMAAWIDAGGCMALTPDGPRGPRMRAMDGPVRLARLTGAPMMAFAWSTTSRVVVDSWDRLILPLPFGRGVIVWKGPIFAPDSDDREALETARQALENALNEASREADLATGCPAIEPAPPREPRPGPMSAAPAEHAV